MIFKIMFLLVARFVLLSDYRGICLTTALFCYLLTFFCFYLSVALGFVNPIDSDCKAPSEESNRKHKIIRARKGTRFVPESAMTSHPLLVTKTESAEAVAVETTPEEVARIPGCTSEIAPIDASTTLPGTSIAEFRLQGAMELNAIKSRLSGVPFPVFVNCSTPRGKEDTSCSDATLRIVKSPVPVQIPSAYLEPVAPLCVKKKVSATENNSVSVVPLPTAKRAPAKIPLRYCEPVKPLNIVKTTPLHIASEVSPVSERRPVVELVGEPYFRNSRSSGPRICDTYVDLRSSRNSYLLPRRKRDVVRRKLWGLVDFQSRKKGWRPVVKY